MRSASVELAAALAVLLLVGVIAGSGSGRHRPTTQPASNVENTAAVTELIGDVTALQHDAASAAGGGPANSWAAATATDGARLGHDLASARALAPPPSASVATEWGAALAQLGPLIETAGRLVQDSGEAPSRLQADIQSLDAASSAAGDSLLRLAARLER